MALNNLTRIGNSGFGTDTSINTTGIVTAVSFSGDGSGLTGITAVGSGVVVQEEGSNVGTAQTINFIGTGVTATISGGIASIEIATSGGGGGGLSDIVSDTTPQLGGNLDLNSKNITGTGVTITPDGNAAFSGIVTAFDLDVDGHTNLDNVGVVGVSTFDDAVNIKSAIYLNGPGNQSDLYIGSSNQVKLDHNGGSAMWSNTVGLSYISTKGGVVVRKEGGGYDNIIRGIADGAVELYNDNYKKFETTSTGAIVTGTLVATATTATNVTVANEASDTECFVMFGVNATGNNAPKSSSSLKYNSSSGGLSAGSFIGDGSGLTGITASGSGVIVRDDGSLVGTAGTIDFGSNVSVSPISAGVVTVTAAAGSIPGISTAQTTQLTNLTVAGVSTFQGNVNLLDDDELRLGNSNDLRIYHSGFGRIISTGVLTLNADDDINLDIGANVGDTVNIRGGSGGSETLATFAVNGSVDLYYDNSKKFETLGAGVTVFGTTQTQQLNVSGISTFTGNVILNANLDLQDDDKILLGSGDDLEIYHTGSHSFIVDSGVGDLYIRTSSGYIQDQGNANQSWLRFNSGAGVEAHFAGNKKFETTNAGITVTGTASATTFSGSGANLTNLPAPTPADTDVQVTYDVSSNGSSGYRFTGPGYSGADDNPDIYLVRGQRYRFINGTGSGHPFRIQSNTSGTAYTDGVSGSQSGTQDFNVQHDAPVRLYYQCTIHSGMIGNIYVVGASDWRMTNVATSATPEIYTNLNVGIGTDNPDGNLHVYNSSAGSVTAASDANELVLESATNVGMSFLTANDSLSRIKFGDPDATNAGIIIYSHADDSFRFQHTSNERLRIKSTGEVQIGDAGLGSDNGDRKLEVIGSGNGQAGLLIANNAISASGTCDISFAPSNKVVGAQIICEAKEDFASSANRTADLTFQTRKDGTLSEKLRIDSSGRLLVGATVEGAPAADNLTLEDSGSCGLTIRAGTSDYSTIYLSDATSGVGEYAGSLQYGHADNSLRIGTNSIERLRITSDGKFGFNTTNPGAFDSGANHFVILGNTSGTGNAGITIASGTDSYCNIYFADGTSGADAYRGHIAYNHNGNSMRFATNGTEKLRITSAGLVGINETSPDTQLHIKGAFNQNDGTGYLKVENTQAVTNSGSNTSLTIKSHNATSQFMNWEDRGMRIGQRIIHNSSTGDLYFTAGNDTVRLTINASNGNFTGSSSADISDGRLKENIQDISASDAVTIIKGLQGRTFTWKEEAKMGTDTKYGFIAQEVETVIPNLVHQNMGINRVSTASTTQGYGQGEIVDDYSDAYKDDAQSEWSKSVEKTGIIPVLVEALKDAFSKIETLEAKVAALES